MSKEYTHDWHCYVCDDFIGRQVEPLTLCGKSSCQAQMGIIKVGYPETNLVDNTEGEG